MSHQDNRPLPAELTIRPFIDLHIEQHGHEPLSVYVESDWLRCLGPTSTLLYRRLGSWVTMQEEPMTIPTEELARDLGIGRGLHAQAPLPRSIGRLCLFDAARWHGEALAVRRALPDVPHHLRRTA